MYNRLKKNKLVIVPSKEDVKDAIELAQPYVHVITESLQYKNPDDHEAEVAKPSRNIIDVFIHCQKDEVVNNTKRKFVASESIRQANLPIYTPGTMRQIDKEDDAMRCFEFLEKRKGAPEAVQDPAASSSQRSRRRTKIYKKQTTNRATDDQSQSATESPASRRRSNTLERNTMKPQEQVDLDFSS